MCTYRNQTITPNNNKQSQINKNKYCHIYCPLLQTYTYTSHSTLALILNSHP